MPVIRPQPRLSPARRRVRGFTLVEAVAVMVITGIIGAMVAVFLQAPVRGYFDAVRRARLSDTADTALRRVARDLRLALPNSIRVSSAGGRQYVEFLQTRAGGRYRADPDAGGGGDVLDFTSGVDAAFDVLGPPVTLAPGDQIVVFNLGLEGSDAYAGANRRAYTGAAGAQSNVSFAASGDPFPYASPGQRFHVVDTPVSYECDPATRSLRRYWGYAISLNQATPPAGATNALLADGVAACSFAYNPDAGRQRSGVFSMTLKLAEEGEAVDLFQQTHVSNLP